MRNFIKRFDFLAHFYQLFFKPDALIKETLVHSGLASSENLPTNVIKLRAKAIRALKIVLLTVCLAVAAHLVLVGRRVHLNHRVIVSLRLLGYSFVLWGVLSPVGYAIQTFDGETLPEILDEEWHRFAYVVGLICLLLSYLSEW